MQVKVQISKCLPLSSSAAPLTCSCSLYLIQEVVLLLSSKLLFCCLPHTHWFYWMSLVILFPLSTFGILPILQDSHKILFYSHIAFSPCPYFWEQFLWHFSSLNFMHNFLMWHFTHILCSCIRTINCGGQSWWLTCLTSSGSSMVSEDVVNDCCHLSPPHFNSSQDF